MGDLGGARRAAGTARCGDPGRRCELWGGMGAEQVKLLCARGGATDTRAEREKTRLKARNNRSTTHLREGVAGGRKRASRRPAESLAGMSARWGAGEEVGAPLRILTHRLNSTLPRIATYLD